MSARLIYSSGVAALVMFYLIPALTLADADADCADDLNRVVISGGISEPTVTGLLKSLAQPASVTIKQSNPAVNRVVVRGGISDPPVDYNHVTVTDYNRVTVTDPNTPISVPITTWTKHPQTPSPQQRRNVAGYGASTKHRNVIFVTTDVPTDLRSAERYIAIGGHGVLPQDAQSNVATDADRNEAKLYGHAVTGGQDVFASQDAQTANAASLQTKLYADVIPGGQDVFAPSQDSLRNAALDTERNVADLYQHAATGSQDVLVLSTPWKESHVARDTERNVAKLYAHNDSSQQGVWPQPPVTSIGLGSIDNVNITELFGQISNDIPVNDVSASDVTASPYVTASPSLGPVAGNAATGSPGSSPNAANNVDSQQQPGNVTVGNVSSPSSKSSSMSNGMPATVTMLSVAPDSTTTITIQPSANVTSCMIIVQPGLETMLTNVVFEYGLITLQFASGIGHVAQLPTLPSNITLIVERASPSVTTSILCSCPSSSIVIRPGNVIDTITTATANDTLKIDLVVKETSLFASMLGATRPDVTLSNVVYNRNAATLPTATLPGSNSVPSLSSLQQEGFVPGINSVSGLPGVSLQTPVGNIPNYVSSLSGSQNQNSVLPVINPATSMSGVSLQIPNISDYVTSQSGPQSQSSPYAGTILSQQMLSPFSGASLQNVTASNISGLLNTASFVTSSSGSQDLSTPNANSPNVLVGNPPGILGAMLQNNVTSPTSGASVAVTSSPGLPLNQFISTPNVTAANDTLMSVTANTTTLPSINNTTGTFPSDSSNNVTLPDDRTNLISTANVTSNVTLPVANNNSGSSTMSNSSTSNVTLSDVTNSTGPSANDAESNDTTNVTLPIIGNTTVPSTNNSIGNVSLPNTVSSISNTPSNVTFNASLPIATAVPSMNTSSSNVTISKVTSPDFSNITLPATSNTVPDVNSSAVPSLNDTSPEANDTDLTTTSTVAGNVMLPNGTNSAVPSTRNTTSNVSLRDGTNTLSMNNFSNSMLPNDTNPAAEPSSLGNLPSNATLGNVTNTAGPSSSNITNNVSLRNNNSSAVPSVSDFTANVAVPNINSSDVPSASEFTANVTLPNNNSSAVPSTSDFTTNVTLPEVIDTAPPSMNRPMANVTNPVTNVTTPSDEANAVTPRQPSASRPTVNVTVPGISVNGGRSPAIPSLLNTTANSTLPNVDNATLPSMQTPTEGSTAPGVQSNGPSPFNPSISGTRSNVTLPIINNNVTSPSMSSPAIDVADDVSSPAPSVNALTGGNNSNITSPSLPSLNNNTANAAVPSVVLSNASKLYASPKNLGWNVTSPGVTFSGGSESALTLPNGTNSDVSVPVSHLKRPARTPVSLFSGGTESNTGRNKNATHLDRRHFANRPLTAHPGDKHLKSKSLELRTSTGRPHSDGPTTEGDQRPLEDRSFLGDFGQESNIKRLLLNDSAPHVTNSTAEGRTPSPDPVIPASVQPAGKKRNITIAPESGPNDLQQKHKNRERRSDGKAPTKSLMQDFLSVLGLEKETPTPENNITITPAPDSDITNPVTNATVIPVTNTTTIPVNSANISDDGLHEKLVIDNATDSSTLSSLQAAINSTDGKSAQLTDTTSGYNMIFASTAAPLNGGRTGNTKSHNNVDRHPGVMTPNNDLQTLFSTTAPLSGSRTGIMTPNGDAQGLYGAKPNSNNDQDQYGLKPIQGLNGMKPNDRQGMTPPNSDVQLLQQILGPAVTVASNDQKPSQPQFGRHRLYESHTEPGKLY